MKGRDLPSTQISQENNYGAELNLRIEAFLSLKSTNTQRTYRGVIQEWCSFLKRHFPANCEAAGFLAATDLHAAAYRCWLEKRPGQAPRLRQSTSLKNKGRLPASGRSRFARRDGLQSTLSNATIAKKFAALRRIYRMLMAYDFGIQHNPFDTDRVPPPPARSGQKRPTEMIDFGQVKEILTTPDSKTPKGRRDRTLLAVLFGAGLRRSELIGLRIGDVRTTSAGTTYLYLRSTKARTDAKQALPDWAASSVRELVLERRKQRAGDGDFLFVSYRGKGGKFPTELPLSDSGLYKLFVRYCRMAGVDAKVSPHSARATAITKLLSDGVSHREVQEFSRHASVQMVEAYDKRRLGVDENPARELDYGDE